MTPLDELLAWAADRWETPPLKIHRSGVWSDVEGGSALGSPAWTADYRRWIEESPFATVHESQVGVNCVHPQQSPKDRKHGLPCPDCQETGIRDVHRLRYRWPMRAALATIAKRDVPAGRPRLDSVTWQLAMNDWSVSAMAAVLALDFPALADPGVAGASAHTALRQLRWAYREDAEGRSVRWTDKSDSQRAAESVA